MGRLTEAKCRNRERGREKARAHILVGTQTVEVLRSPYLIFLAGSSELAFRGDPRARRLSVAIPDVGRGILPRNYEQIPAADATNIWQGVPAIC